MVLLFRVFTNLVIHKRGSFPDAIAFYPVVEMMISCLTSVHQHRHRVEPLPLIAKDIMENENWEVALLPASLGVGMLLVGPCASGANIKSLEMKNKYSPVTEIPPF